MTSEKFKKIINIISNVFLVIALTIAILFGVSTVAADKPNVLGYRCLWVASGSMEPTIDTEQFIFGKVTDGSDIQVGDIVGYKRIDELTGVKAIIVHRVIEIYEENGTIYYVFKGDNNETQDEKPVKQEDLMYKIIKY